MAILGEALEGDVAGWVLSLADDIVASLRLSK